MDRLRLLALALLLAAFASFGYGALQGELQGGLFLVFPVLIGSGPWALLGMLLLFGAFLTWGASTVRMVEEEARRRGVEPQEPAWSEPREVPVGPREREPEPWDEAPGEDGEDDGGFLSGGGIILLGPIPIVWGSDKRTTLWIALVALVITLVAFAWWWLAGGNV